MALTGWNKTQCYLNYFKQILDHPNVDDLVPSKLQIWNADLKTFMGQLPKGKRVVFWRASPLSCKQLHYFPSYFRFVNWNQFKYSPQYRTLVIWLLDRLTYRNKPINKTYNGQYSCICYPRNHFGLIRSSQQLQHYNRLIKIRKIHSKGLFRY